MTPEEEADQRAEEDASQERLMKHIRRLIGKMNDAFLLRGLKHAWEERMKTLLSESLKPGSDEVITDLDALDYAWSLPGDRVIHGDDPNPKMRFLDYFVGRKVDTFGGVGPLVKMKDGGYGIQIELPCQGGCGKTYTGYAVPGCHTGAFCYINDEDGNHVADLRDQCYTCDECRPQIDAKLDAIDEKYDQEGQDGLHLPPT